MCVRVCIYIKPKIIYTTNNNHITNENTPPRSVLAWERPAGGTAAGGAAAGGAAAGGTAAGGTAAGGTAAGGTTAGGTAAGGSEWRMKSLLTSSLLFIPIQFNDIVNNQNLVVVVVRLGTPCSP